jgi:hypothetical protein
MTAADGSKSTLEYKNLQIGALPADTFTVPSGITLTDMSEMMKQVPKSQ